jgi:hypothetical protein
MHSFLDFGLLYAGNFLTSEGEKREKSRNENKEKLRGKFSAMNFGIFRGERGGGNGGELAILTGKLSAFNQKPQKHQQTHLFF